MLRKPLTLRQAAFGLILLLGLLHGISYLEACCAAGIVGAIDGWKGDSDGR